MNGSNKILPTHRHRQAVVYLRQSTPKQVLKNRESAVNQPALRGRLLEMGWRKDQIVLIDEDQARTAKQTAGRDGFQQLVADVSLRKVGLIIGYEVARLSRNCADWHQLLELCGLFDTLLADADGRLRPARLQRQALARAEERCNIPHSHSTFAASGSVSSRSAAAMSATCSPP